MAIVQDKYAQSLFEVAQAQGVHESVHQDLAEIKKALAGNKAFFAFAEDPKVSSEKRHAFVNATFTGVDTPLKNLLSMLADKKQLGLLPAIADFYTKHYNKFNHQQYMKVESVYALSEEELDEIGKAFIKRTGYKKLLIENVVNSTLIGGIRATIGTTVYDGSVANELTQLEKSFHKQ
ncbi:ATP synthase F1 subunit delta [Macrococcus armenti]|uniref:ATP synthase F1 subunit delta n=1 Tax=Macrococcus armenti TaxID=2875764 RepID=UPI001CCB430F|nr:ATP synthase F1 subunit delta [Macrococcus armenti]UBH22153.1 ATP synthase F1 subunit delta [Macrococcus armenti]